MEAENKEKNPSKKEKKEPVLYKPDYKFPKIKIPKQVYKQIKDVVPLTNDELKQYLTAIALGAIPDRFQMEASMQDRLKAIDQLTKLNVSVEEEESEEQVGVIIDDIPDDDEQRDT